MNPRTLALVFAAAWLSHAASAAELRLACQGQIARTDMTGDSQYFATWELKIDTDTGQLMRFDGPSCWAGRGSCNVLVVRVTDTSLSANAVRNVAAPGST